MESPTQTPLRPVPAGNPADYSFEPDPAMQAILAKKASGAKLTSSEGGLLGQFKKKLKSAFGSDAAGTPSPAAASSAPVGASPVSPTHAPTACFPAVPPDSELVRRVTGSLLEGVNKIGSRKLTSAARVRGADGETLLRFERAKVFDEDRKTLIMQTAPEAFEAMGVTNGKAFALSVFWGNIGLGACDFWLAIDELNRMEKKEAKPKPTTPAPTTPQSAIEPQVPGQPSGSRIPQAEPPPPFVEKNP